MVLKAKKTFSIVQSGLWSEALVSEEVGIKMA